MKTTLFRPIGIGEYVFIKESGYAVFPPRLNWQPIFYPVLNQEYAAQIAKDWNTVDEFSGYCGLVTSFEVEASFLERYPVQNVGGKIYEELWIPAEELVEFNKQILGKIKIVDAFFGPAFGIKKHTYLNEYYEKYNETTNR